MGVVELDDMSPPNNQTAAQACPELGKGLHRHRWDSRQVAARYAMLRLSRHVRHSPVASREPKGSQARGHLFAVLGRARLGDLKSVKSFICDFNPEW